MNIIFREKIMHAHLNFAEIRGPEKTYCPSELARTLFPKDWKQYMDIVREVADILVAQGKLETLQQGNVISEPPSSAKGPIRLRKAED